MICHRDLMPKSAYRGSRKHILDLIDSGCFVETMNALLGQAGVNVRDTDHHQPRGYADDIEWTLRHFCHVHCSDLLDLGRFDQWWVPDRYRNPQWDLLSTCTIDGKAGLLMVEAKANENEVSRAGKSIGPTASDRARMNHARIGRCIAEAAADLSRRFDGIGISRDTHYQLSNRVASAWKLAECGLSVALLYLGFIGDYGVSDAGVPLADHDHWQRVMGAYMAGVLPLRFPGQVVGFANCGSMRMLVKSLLIIEVSPPPFAKST